MADVFISYARSSAARAQAVARSLGLLGYDVWIDDALPSHRSFAEVIEEQIADARAVLVIWSHDAVRSEWVRSEANHAREAKKLVQAAVEKTRLPMPFDQLHCADLSQWSGESDHPAWLSVLSSLAQLVDHQGAERKAASPAAQRDERRHLTVLSCGLADAGRMATALDPEEWRAVSTAYRKLASKVLSEAGGHVAASGETMVAYFGYPVAQEHAAQRAVAAGLALVARIGALPVGDKGSASRLAAKVGIDAGVVVVSHAPAGAVEVFGDTPAHSNAVQVAAEPGVVLVTPKVRELVAGQFTLREREGLEANGAPLFEASAASIAPAHHRGAIARTAFVGRAEEIGLLHSRWERSGEGQSQFALIVGEPGIGKSRLIDEFRVRIRADAHQWLECAGSPLYANTAFHPVVGLVRQIIGWRQDDSPERRQEKLGAALADAGLDVAEAGPLVAELLGLAAPVALAPEERRRRLLGVLIQWVMGASRVQPLIIVVEDLHWIDASSMELIRILADRQTMARLMVICTARPEFQAAWPQRGYHLRVSMGRLSARDARALLASVADRASLDKSLVETLIARTDGVPLFVEELTRLVLEGPDHRHDIPATLLDSLAARLDRLGPARQTAQLAAVIGREFDYPLLAAVSPLEAAALDDNLAKLIDAELIFAHGLPPQASYRFKHALIVDAAYDALLKSERRALHARVAKVVAEDFPALAADHPELLARHWAGAGEDDKAVALYRQAAQSAASRAAHVEAVEHLRTALALVRRQEAGPGRAVSELPVLLGLAVSLAATKGYTAPELGEVLAEARSLCDQLGNVAGLFAVLIGLCNFHSVAGDMAAAKAAALHCQRIGEETGQPSQRIQASFVLGYCHYSLGELAQARVLLERSAALYAEHDGGSLSFFSPTDPLVECLSTLPIVLYALGEIDEAGERAEALLTHARGRERPYELAYALAFRWVYDILARAFDASLAHADEELALCETHGYANFRAVALTMKGLSTGATGQIERGLAVAREGVSELERMGILRAIGLYLGEAARLELANGDRAAALASLERAIASASRSIRICLPRLHLLRAEILAPADPAAAAAAREEALAIAREQGARTFENEALAALR